MCDHLGSEGCSKTTSGLCAGGHNTFVGDSNFLRVLGAPPQTRCGFVQSGATIRCVTHALRLPSKLLGPVCLMVGTNDLLRLHKQSRERVQRGDEARKFIRGLLRGLISVVEALQGPVTFATIPPIVLKPGDVPMPMLPGLYNHHLQQAVEGRFAFPRCSQSTCQQWCDHRPR